MGSNGKQRRRRRPLGRPPTHRSTGKQSEVTGSNAKQREATDEEEEEEEEEALEAGSNGKQREATEEEEALQEALGMAAHPPKHRESLGRNGKQR